MPLSSDIQAFQAVLRESKTIVALAGAGLSAASGIPTFRGAGGFWRAHNVIELATPRAFRADPGRVWQFCHYRRELMKAAKPNRAHLALAMLSVPEHLQRIAPNAHFTLITQNIDGLSTRALQQLDQVVKAPVIEMHGRLMDTVCTVCGERRPNDDTPIFPALADTDSLFTDHGGARIPLEQLPRCSGSCGGLLRPGVVWFGEDVLHGERVDQLVGEADLILVVGTSSTVYPAAGYARRVFERGGTVVIFNAEPLNEDEADNEKEHRHFYFTGPCEETLPLALFGAELGTELGGT
ncbi:DHS-like NAD/FAD-binding domain-containing protein [Leucogyrophana mollusca]|uniref:DHS-like NAD/FAD-binding domain-containing protein n=1 Tax=Leucogyrophana mollusca TaxID=85980 RepID=A0ACB8BDG9_9AGAM|nr:DHS-like NAD/FAD-binding domain-containing protein [Leucogyrophana mollusca]